MAELTKKTMDGNEAAAYTSYAFTENAAIYPITERIFSDRRLTSSRWSLREALPVLFTAHSLQVL